MFKIYPVFSTYFLSISNLQALLLIKKIHLRYLLYVLIWAGHLKIPWSDLILMPDLILYYLLQRHYSLHCQYLKASNSKTESFIHQKPFFLCSLPFLFLPFQISVKLNFQYFILGYLLICSHHLFLILELKKSYHLLYYWTKTLKLHFHSTYYDVFLSL